MLISASHKLMASSLENNMFSISVDTLINTNEVNFAKIYNEADKYYDNNEYEKSFPLFLFLSKNEYKKAYAILASSYMYGKGVEVNKALAAYWYDKAINSGYDWCGYNLGNYLCECKMYSYAIKCYTKSMNTNIWKGQSALKLADIYLNGLVSQSDTLKAIELYKVAAEDHVTLRQAQSALENFGVSLNNDNDFEKAKLQINNNLSAKEMYYEAEQYREGLSRSINQPLAYAYYLAAAEKGYPEANEWMGYLSTDESYPIKSDEIANQYFNKALSLYKERAKVENKMSDYSKIGDFYRRGLGVDKNLNSAVEWYLIGANNGHDGCQLWLGQCYKELGKCSDALIWLCKAGDNGQGWAAYLAGQMYEEGCLPNIPTNMEEAIIWYKKSSKTNNYYARYAKQALERLGFDY